MEENENLESTTQQDTSNSPTRTRVGFPQPKKEKKGGKGTLIFIALAILALVLVGAWLIFGRGESEEIVEQEVTPTVSEETSSPTPIPTQVEIDRDEVSIQILNGTGIGGAAGDLQDEMKDLGYSDIEVGNASSQDYETTSVIFSSDLSKEVVDEITDKLKSIYKDVDSETGETDEYDVEIITGYPKNYSPTATPTEKPEATATSIPTPEATETATPTL